MTTLKTITTIELASSCSLKCSYCINRLMPTQGRDYEIMSDEVFDSSLDVLLNCVKQGTQAEVNLNGNGESLLDPDILDRIRAVRGVMGAGQVQMCSNGTHLTEELAQGMIDAGISRCDISIHDTVAARKAVDIMKAVNMPGVLAVGPVHGSHNWCDQIEPEHRVKHIPVGVPCKPLMEGRGYIQSNGDVSPCCYDYRSLGAFGNVFDNDLFERNIKRFELCGPCHQEIPEGIG